MATVLTTTRGNSVTLFFTSAITLLGAGVIAGWHLRLRPLVQVIPESIPMQYNTALCFLVLGASAGALVKGRFGRALPTAGGAFVAAMGALVAFQYASGASLGVDTLFFYPWERKLSADPGRMALTTAVSFVAAGGTLALYALRPAAAGPFVIAHTLPLSFGLTSLLGYLLGITYVLPFRLGSQMAVHTALGFTLYGGAMLAYALRRAPRTQEGLPRWSPGIAVVMLPVLFVGTNSAFESMPAAGRAGQIAFTLAGVALLGFAIHRLRQERIIYKGIILISIPLVFVLAFVFLVNQLKRSGEQAHALSAQSKEVIATAHALLGGLVAAQSDARSYVITEDAAYLESYQVAEREVRRDVQRLLALTRDNSGQKARAEEMAAKVAERLGLLAVTRDLMVEGRKDEAGELIKGGEGKRLMGELGAGLDSFLKEEERIDEERQRRLREAWQHFDWLLVAGAAADLLLALTLVYLFTRGIGRRLQTLTENAEALAAGRELARPLSGTDEIAHLDRVFHRMAQELRGAREELEVKVEERTSELSQANERLTEQIAERLKAEESLRESEHRFLQSQKLEAVGRLAGGVAHDFNNLLTIITGHSELLLRRVGREDPARHRVEEIKRAGERAAGLTRQLLAFSRKQMMQPKVFELNGLVQESGRMLRRLIGEDVELELRPNPAAGRVNADPGQIEQVLVNLVVNARDAMPGGGRIVVETAAVSLDERYTDLRLDVRRGAYVMLAVSDTGHGMDEATRQRIFEPFFTTKEQGKGTGLGLSTVYGIVKQSDGNIYVYSEPGKGTTVKVYLPHVESVAEQEEAADAPESAGGSETVLLAEDEPSVRSLAAGVLAEAGYKVLEAADGAEALRLAGEYRGTIHVLVTDVVMPVLGGRELADRLTAGRPGLRVIYMSGYTDDAIVHHGVLDAGIILLEKPFTPEGLKHKVREVLDSAGRGCGVASAE
jgi:signal transduction histidine kinase